jgi:O-methyltransferase
MSAAVKLVKRLASKFGYDVHRRTPTPLVSPWINNESFRTHFDAIESLTLISADRCYVLYTLALQASCLHGHWYECGVYKGGSAILLSNLISENRRHEQTELHLFDTFEGMPEPNPSKDLHRQGDFSDASVDTVVATLRSLTPNPDIVHFHKGFIPDTFSSVGSHSIAFAHVDVDLYQSVMSCCNFIYPRLQAGGFMIFDDYGFPTCPGAQQAVDEFFEDKPEVPLVLTTGQALVFKL